VYCTHCGSERPDNASSCPQCGTPVPYFAAPVGAPGGTVPNYLVQSILVTLCCCLPAGVVAIIFAAQVNSKLAAGDVAGAMAASRNAKIWSWVGFGLGCAAIVLSMISGGIREFLNAAR
jgi:hypothetical protein